MANQSGATSVRAGQAGHAVQFQPIRLIENFRAIFYLPFYLMRALRHAEDEGLEIEWVDANMPGAAGEHLKSGSAHVSWGGPMRIMRDHDSESLSPKSLVGFGEVVGRDPFCLVGRKSLLPFNLRDLATRRLAVVTEVPTPWLCLQQDLRDAGANVRAMQAALASGGLVSQERSQSEQLAALQAGEIDVMQAFEPYVSQALQDPA